MSRDPLDLRLGLPGAAAAIGLIGELCASLRLPTGDLAAALLGLRVEVERALAPPPPEDPEAPPVPPVRFDARDPRARTTALALARVPAELRGLLDAVQCINGMSQALTGGNWTEAMTAIAQARLAACAADPRLRARLTLLALLDPRLARAVRLLMRAAVSTHGAADVGWRP